MTNHQDWTEKLSDFLDGELTTGEHQAVEAHLAACPACSAVLADLRGVVERAQNVEARPPDADLWAGISARIAAPAGAAVVAFPERQPRRFTFSLPQLAAASLLIAAISGGFVWSLAQRQAGVAPAAGAGPAAQQSTAASATTAEPIAEPADQPIVERVSLADQQYDAAVVDLENALKQGRGRLDAATIAIVEHNLTTIDEAIRQARDALAADPADAYLSGHLVEARRRKLDLLRRATALTSESN